MYGLRHINNVYIGDGTGRDSIITLNSDFRGGKERSPSASISAFAGRTCEPRGRVRRDGPNYLDSDRIESLFRGKHSPHLREKVPRAYSLPELTKTWSSKPGAREIRSCCQPLPPKRSPLAQAAAAAGAGGISPKASSASFSGILAVEAASQIRHH
eukprot:CAMPEP_0204018556 /NCGR_PEP_ID=MMETSP0360-20130528/28155_1 /ASSEMBLY_ACC=CAM_ASM_000342 /TAXON_ID=268821 /ORGANISM="Scrippsiella Hangoei, Strain SHTV-5" /LENGTH=155 /DNA_ID=CAMNT_0050961695 /DNA_START=38 /DNA_END=502 /DNA_ORIENTATION=-